MLERGLRAKLILVSAPAGSGKSTMLAAWLKQLDRPAAWLSLEPGDNNLSRFLLYLVSALQQLEPELGAGLPEVLQLQSSVNAEPLLIRLTNDLAQLDDNLILVLDDYHTVSDPTIHDAVEFLLDHLPTQFCLVIATRTDPPLALSRLRVRDQLLEVRRADLRFDMSETTHFLNNRLGLELSPTAITSLAARTEGWIAALQLAALSLTGRPDKEAFVEAFAGSHRFLVDYLVDEVLSRQPTQMQAFLQRTAILERFTAPLCEAVTGQPTSADLLERLEAANLFLIPLDDERRWYRFHHLFAEFLQHRLKDAEAERMPELHRRASAWFEGEGWTDEAIRHAFLAADDNLAARLVDDAAAELALHWHNKQLIKYVNNAALLPFIPAVHLYCWP
jgi:LuxR family maltose regulon positive regulatory protein